MNILADENMPLVEETFGHHGEVIRKPGRSIAPEDCRDIDILLVRSVTKVNAELLKDSSVRFVGTATIGTDHLDIEYLDKKGIFHTSAPGCNADSVAEYVVCTIAHLISQNKIKLSDLKAGIIGAGQVGRRVAQRMKALNIPFIQYDPLRRDDPNDDFVGCYFEDLQACSLICAHAPLTQTGPYPSFHMLDETFFKLLADNTVFISAGRGPVVDFNALRIHLHRFICCLDVWEPEPDIPEDVLEKVDFATPHVAGYSLQSKWRGTSMLYQTFRRFLNLPETIIKWPMEANHIQSQSSRWHELVLEIYDPLLDTKHTQGKLLGSPNISKDFDLLRKTYPLRHEFSFPIIENSSLTHQDKIIIENLGFKLKP